MIRRWMRKFVVAYVRRQQKLDKLKRLGRPSIVSRTATFTFHSGISIGKYCRIGPDCHLDGEGGIEIGDGTIFAPSVTILSSSHHYQQAKFLPYDETDNKAPVQIGAGVWIGYGAIILPGTNIGNGAVVAAGSVVTKDVAAGEIVGGNPAIKINKRTLNEKEIDEMVRDGKFYMKAALSDATQRAGRAKSHAEVLK